LTTKDLESDIIIIGAGPSGAVAAALLRKHGYQVTMLEKQHFPVFPLVRACCPSAWSF